VILSLQYHLVCFIFWPVKSKFLVRQAKPGEFSWLGSQPDKVSLPSEPSLALMRVIAGVKRRQEDRGP
jgi:hypothetical protein